MADYLSKAEFSRALGMVQDREKHNLDTYAFMQGDNGTWEKFETMWGGSEIVGDRVVATKGQKVTCTLRELALLIAYQCVQLNGELDADALDEIWGARYRILIFGEGSDEVVAEQQRRAYYRQKIDKLAGVC